MNTPQVGPRASRRQWLAVSGAMLGAFMAVLDIQITNASLKDILGSLGATLEEGSWVSTSYLVAEIIVIPLTAWLADVFSPRRYLLGTTLLFLAASVACAWARDLSGLITFRVIQGFTGGAMIPMALTLVLQLLPERQHGIGFAVFGMTATVAPAIGPAIGGWLTENYGWPWIFYMNLLPGTAMLAALAWGLDRTAPQPEKFRRGDWAGMLTIAIGLGCLITLLEEGHRNDWFDSPEMTALAVVSALTLAAGVWIELRQAEPFIDLRLLGSRDFALAGAISAVFGLGMYGVMYALPVYLASIQGYNAGQIGHTIMWSGVPQLVMMPVAAWLARRTDARLLISAGLGLFAVSCLLNGRMTHWTEHDQLRATQLIRALGMPMVIVPLTMLATRSLSAERAGSASALFNMLRNLGGSVGVALLATRIDTCGQSHAARLGETVSSVNPATVERLGVLTGYFVSRGVDPATAGRRALRTLDLTVRREAWVMAYGDAFTLLGIIFIGCVPLVWWINGRAATGSNCGAAATRHAH